MSHLENRRIIWSDVPGLVLLFLLGVVVLLQFITRYVLNDSLAWTEEIARYLLIGTAYSGSITALRKGEHIFLELVYRVAPRVNVKPLAVMAAAISGVFHALLATFAVWLSMDADRRMISVDLPKSIVYGFVAAALFVSTAYAVRLFATRLRQNTDDIIGDIERTAAGDASR